jgi:hypothetical protein
MPTIADSGQKDLVWANKDVNVAIANDGIADAIGDSPYVDLKDGTSNLLPDQLFFSFDISVASVGANMLVYAIFSEDGTENPPSGSPENKKILVASLVEVSTLARSNIYSVPCLGRYFRLAYQNDGSGASVTMSSRYATSFQQSYSA